MIKTAKDARISEDNLRKKLYLIIGYLAKQTKGKKINQKTALNILLKKDAEIISKSKPTNYEPNEVYSYYEKFVKIADSFGLKPTAKVFIVKEFPSPYQNIKFNAMQIDIDDQKNFGLVPGIYFRQDRMAPFLSVYILSHELAHSCLGKVHVNRLARGLEEGLADIFAIHLCSKIMDKKTLENLVINMRTPIQKNYNKQLYFHSLKQAFVLYEKIGLDGIMDILRKGQKNGRTVIKKVEEQIIENKWSKLKPSKNNTNNSVLNSISTKFLTYPYSMVVSPLAFYLADKLEIGSDVSTVLKQHNIDQSEGREAVKELQEKIYLVVSNNNKIFYNESKVFLKTRTLKYEA